MKYHFKAHMSNQECWAECLELEGCVTQGRDFEDLKLNAYDALNLYLDEPEDSKVISPLPKSIPANKRNVFEVEVEPQIAFSFLLRQTRVAHGLTQKAMAEKLKMENLYSYQRLERRANPTLSTVKKIIDIIPDFPFQYVL
jgi:predicted RNase H-like HicB family nuclease